MKLSKRQARVLVVLGARRLPVATSTRLCHGWRADGPQAGMEESCKWTAE